MDRWKHFLGPTGWALGVPDAPFLLLIAHPEGLPYEPASLPSLLSQVQSNMAGWKAEGDCCLAGRRGLSQISWPYLRPTEEVPAWASSECTGPDPPSETLLQWEYCHWCTTMCLWSSHGLNVLPVLLCVPAPYICTSQCYSLSPEQRDLTAHLVRPAGTLLLQGRQRVAPLTMISAEATLSGSQRGQLRRTAIPRERRDNSWQTEWPCT